MLLLVFRLHIAHDQIRYASTASCLNNFTIATAAAAAAASAAAAATATATTKQCQEMKCFT